MQQEQPAETTRLLLDFLAVTARAMPPLPLNEVFKLAPGPVPVLMFLRVALAVGLPMVGFTLAGQPLAAVASRRDGDVRHAVRRRPQHAAAASA